MKHVSTWGKREEAVAGLVWLSLALGLAAVAGTSVWAAAVSAVLLGHVAVSVGETVVHRNVYHGHWAWIKAKRPPALAGAIAFLQPVVDGVHGWLRAGYVHHWVVHHDHARRAPAEVATTGMPPADLAAEADNVHGAGHAAALYYSSYGMECFLFGIAAHTSTLLATPMPLVGAVLGGWYAWAGTSAAGVAALMTLFWLPACWYAASSCGYHKYLHLRPKLRAAATPWWLRWLVLSREGARLAADHHAHHFGANADAYYNIVPLGRWFTWWLA